MRELGMTRDGRQLAEKMKKVELLGKMNIFADMPTEGEIEELYGEFCQIDKKETGTIPVDRMTQLMSSATNTKGNWNLFCLCPQHPPPQA